MPTIANDGRFPDNGADRLYGKGREKQIVFPQRIAWHKEKIPWGGILTGHG